ncbi:MAG: PHP domain-containing protein, partial [Actinobacteria bacterium]|nr:PHP domain-containing protein [Actinomycetota bacterium]
FEACAAHGTAIEINCRPERHDPPDELLALALDLGCHVAINTDAHAPGQLEWQASGCIKATEHGIDPARIINTFGLDELLAWVS